MSILDRRDFLKNSLGAGAAMVGASVMASLSAAPPAPASREASAPAGGPVPEYEIFACKYGGPVIRRVAIVLWNSGWDVDGPFSYYVWAIRARNGETIVVDTGCSPEQSVARKVPEYENPVDVLARLGVTGEQVTRVVLTHMHWDHVGNIEAYLKAFPKARFYVQQREFDFCVNNPVVRRKPIAILFDQPASKVVAGMAGTDRLVLVQGDHHLAPGIDLSLAPGHTLGLMVVRVNTAQGPAVVGSDCAHVFQGYRDDNPSCFIMDMPAWIDSFDKVKAKAKLELIFPGHDVLMATNYPKVAEGVTRLV